MHFLFLYRNMKFIRIFSISTSDIIRACCASAALLRTVRKQPRHALTERNKQSIQIYMCTTVKHNPFLTCNIQLRLDLCTTTSTATDYEFYQETFHGDLGYKSPKNSLCVKKGGNVCNFQYGLA